MNQDIVELKFGIEELPLDLKKLFDKFFPFTEEEKQIFEDRALLEEALYTATYDIKDIEKITPFYYHTVFGQIPYTDLRITLCYPSEHKKIVSYCSMCKCHRENLSHFTYAFECYWGSDYSSYKFSKSLDFK